jgi:peptide/nickel transport system permease protein
MFAALLVVASSSAALLLTRLAPSDVTLELGPRASRAEIEAVRAKFDLNQSAVSQLRMWMGRAVRLDFGTSFLYSRPVAPLVGRAALNTALLAVVALALATAVGLGLGVFTGSRSGGALPALVRGTSLALLSTPPLVTSLLLVFLAARTGWLPPGDMTSSSVVEPTWPAWLVDVAWHLPLPALALALPIGATFERLQSQSIADAVQQPFVRAAAARGVGHRELILRHAWPVSLRPISAIYGIAIGALLSGSFVVEFVTAWPGLGRLMYDGLRARDIYLVAGCAAMGAGFLALGTLAGDLLHAVVDPRVRDGLPS